jgi:hypothetical protein
MPSYRAVHGARHHSSRGVTAAERAHSHASPREQGAEDVAADGWFSEFEYVCNGRTQLALDKAPPPPRLEATCPAYRAKAREAAHAQRIRAFMDTHASIPWREVLGCDLSPPPPAEDSDSDGDVPHTGPTPESPHTPGAYMRRRWGVVRAESLRTAGAAAAECRRGDCWAAARSPLSLSGARHTHAPEILAGCGDCSSSAFLRAGSCGHSRTLAVGWAPVPSVEDGLVTEWQGAAGPTPSAWVPAPRPGWELVDAARPPQVSARRGDFCSTLERLETFCLAYAAVTPPHEPREERPRRRPRARRRVWSPPGRAASQH